MRDVALVPQRNAFEHRHDLCADNPSQPADPLAQDRVALVRHRTGSFLTRTKGLFQLAHLSALAVPNLERDRFTHGGNNRQRGHPLTDAVPDDDLGGDIGRPQPELARHVLLDRGIDVAVTADGSGDLGNCDGVARTHEPVA